MISDNSEQPPNTENFVLKLNRKSADTQQNVDRYCSYFEEQNRADLSNDKTEQRIKDSNSVSNQYYNLATDFYEYGWGQSFHFAPMYKDSNFQQCLSRHENYLALNLGLKAGMKCLDAGCGIGGPMREIAKFSGAKVVGLNYNDYQAKRCDQINQRTGLGDLCSVVTGNFEDMPFQDNSFDAAYAIEATVHASSLELPYGEIYRTLKPGGKFACYEWLTTPKYDEQDPKQREIIHLLEQGNGVSKLQSFDTCLNALRKVGFEILEYRDVAVIDPSMTDAVNPWYQTLKGTYKLSFDSIYRWQMTPVGRFITDSALFCLEKVRLVAPGTRKVSQFLNNGADALVAAGEMGIFTPMFFFVVQKPLDA